MPRCHRSLERCEKGIELTLEETLAQGLDAVENSNWMWIDNVYIPNTIKNVNHENLYDALEKYYKHESGEIRDLAYSFLEQIKLEQLNEKTVGKMRYLIYEGIDDMFLGVRIMSTFAAVKHEFYKEYNKTEQSLIGATLRYTAETKPELKERAEEYLSKLGD